VEVRQADLADAESLARNLGGCQAAFYLVHLPGRNLVLIPSS
jgi:hypothetical protein